MFHLANFDKIEGSIDNEMQFIQLECEKIRIFSERKERQDVLIFIDERENDHSKLISYYQQNKDQKLLLIDPHEIQVAQENNFGISVENAIVTFVTNNEKLKKAVRKNKEVILRLFYY